MAGRNGSVFALGEKLIRLLLFEFDAGPDRVRNGRCIYGKVEPKGVASPRTAATADGSAAAALAAKPRSYPGSGFQVAGATLGTDTPPLVWKAITARGGTPGPTGWGGIGPLRIYGREAAWGDVGQGVYTVAFDFDEDGPGGQLIAVTLFYVAEAADLPRLLEQRAAAVATVYGPLSATSPRNHEGRIGAVRITLGVDPAASAVIETYRVR